MPDELNENQDSQQLLEDLLVLSMLPTDAIGALGDRVEQHDGFVSIKDLVAEFIGELRDRASVERLIVGLKPNAVNSVLGKVNQWRDSSDGAKDVMTDERWATLQKNLPRLVRESPALTRSRKAGVLQTLTGNEVMGVMFVCDARPVFNTARDDIDGYIPLATMKVVYQRQNTDAEEIEFVMIPEEIDLLIKRAEEARDKINVFNQKMTGCLPNALAGGQS